jgi:cytochrome c biogenesis protein CcmG/thiol:disulfide interchange protein DsbE
MKYQFNRIFPTFQPVKRGETFCVFDWLLIGIMNQHLKKGLFMKRMLSISVVLTVFLFTACATQPEKKQKAPNFSLQTQNGKAIELSKLKGKVVLVNFWATWCPPCRAEIPDFIELYDSYKSKGFEIVGIALDEDGWSKVAPYIEEVKINYPVVLGSTKVVQQYGGIEAIPTTFIVDKKGYIVACQVGLLSKELLEQKLKSLLK